MAIEKLDIIQFLQLAAQYPILDVRSPGEFLHAHIPEAHSLPLFTDEERKIVGTAYKQQNRKTAIKIGLEYFGPKMRNIVEEVERITGQTKSQEDKQTVLVHCWRGGMRSAAIAWLLDLYGFKVYTLSGGYKKFRNYVLHSFEKKYSFNILGGFTGSGKTEILHALREMNEATIDLEQLANHKGSAFGSLGLSAQPSQEMFENMLGLALMQVCSKSDNKPIWLEDESQRIGNVNIPQHLWITMRESPLFFLEIPFTERLKHIVNWYGLQNKEKMLQAIVRIKKRLGGLETKLAVNYLIEDDIESCFSILLKYYDKCYMKGLHSRELPIEYLLKAISNKVEATENAQMLLNLKTKN